MYVAIARVLLFRPERSTPSKILVSSKKRKSQKAATTAERKMHFFLLLVAKAKRIKSSQGIILGFLGILAWGFP